MIWSGSTIYCCPSVVSNRIPPNSSSSRIRPSARTILVGSVLDVPAVVDSLSVAGGSPTQNSSSSMAAVRAHRSVADTIADSESSNIVVSAGPDAGRRGPRFVKFSTSIPRAFSLIRESSWCILSDFRGPCPHGIRGSREIFQKTGLEAWSDFCYTATRYGVTIVHYRGTTHS